MVCLHISGEYTMNYLGIDVSKKKVDCGVSNKFTAKSEKQRTK